ncbi:hypothetical protein ACVWXX_000080 [Bacillus toyonensis]
MNMNQKQELSLFAEELYRYMGSVAKFQQHKQVLMNGGTI